MDKITENANNLAKELITTADSQSYIQVVNPTTGKVDNMKISDIASVVAGVIEFGTTKIQYLADNTNLNSVFYNARFYINPDYTGDNPPYSPLEWCVVETIRFSDYYYLQIVRKWWNPNQGKIRCYQNSTWGSWYDL